MARHPKTVWIDSFRGLNNVLKPENTDPEYLKKVDNVNVDKQGNLTKRKGYSLVDTAVYTSLWSDGDVCYAVRNHQLVQINPDLSYTVIDSRYFDNVSFERVDERIYFTSPFYNGVIENGSVRTWGITKPSSPTLSSTTGSLTAGTYQVVTTFLSSFGIESGAGVASTITVGDNSGITVSIPTTANPDVPLAKIYVSAANGETLYFKGSGTPGSNYVISSVTDSVSPLRTFNYDAPLLGNIVKYYRSRLYHAVGNVLYYSEKYKYEHFNLGSNFFEFSDDIRMVLPVEDGIWVATDKLYYLSGSDVESFNLNLKENIKVVPGTEVSISGSYLHLENTPVGYKWLVTSDLGVFILFNQGLVINVTSTNIALDESNKGTGVFLQDSGMNQYLTILNKSSDNNNAVVGDLVESTIIRNGVVIT